MIAGGTLASLVERAWTGGSPSARLVRAFLVPAAWLFGLIVRVRAGLYDAGLLRVGHAGVPVVSVGNLRVGGTGKTPLVIWLVEKLAALGMRPVVVARGYRGPTRDPVLISTAARPATALPTPARGAAPRHVDLSAGDPWQGEEAPAADEALLVALRTGCPVVTAADRVLACELAERAFAADVIVLDDGFQHRRLARDLDIVILAAGDRRAALLPAGPLREGPRALGRADIVLTDDPGAPDPRLVRCASGLVSEYRGFVAPLERLRGRGVVAVAGIARPERFFALIEEAGAHITQRLCFDDHHSYTARDWLRIAEAAGAADLVVTTEKDLVKLRRHAGADAQLFALRLSVDVEDGETLLERVRALDAKHCGQHHPGELRGSGAQHAQPGRSGASGEVK